MFGMFGVLQAASASAAAAAAAASNNVILWSTMDDYEGQAILMPQPPVFFDIITGLTILGIIVLCVWAFITAEESTS